MARAAPGRDDGALGVRVLDVRGRPLGVVVAVDAMTGLAAETLLIVLGILASWCRGGDSCRDCDRNRGGRECCLSFVSQHDILVSSRGRGIKRTVTVVVAASVIVFVTV